MLKVISSLALGVAGNAAFWLINERVNLLTGFWRFVAMAMIFVVASALVYALQARRAAAAPDASLASGNDAGGSLDLTLSGGSAAGGRGSVASGNKSKGDMKIKIENVRLR